MLFNTRNLHTFRELHSARVCGCASSGVSKLSAVAQAASAMRSDHAPLVEFPVARQRRPAAAPHKSRPAERVCISRVSGLARSRNAQCMDQGSVARRLHRALSPSPPHHHTPRRHHIPFRTLETDRNAPSLQSYTTTMVSLTTSDNEQFTVDRDVAERSVLIKQMLEGETKPKQAR